VSRLSRKYGSRDVSQIYEPPWSVTGITLPFTLHTSAAVFTTGNLNMRHAGMKKDVATMLNITSVVITNNAQIHISDDFMQRVLLLNIKIGIYKTIMLPVVLYECETWSLILRKEYRLKVLQNRVLRKMSGTKW
jgi:hypothetical protein